jgi:hypothetical protein
MIEVFVDADFTGNFNKNESNLRGIARWRYGYIIMREYRNPSSN